MDRFSFFFAFYGLILGLAVAELLGGFARLVRARAIAKIEAQTALIALFTFIVICATWIDAFDSLKAVSLDFAGLWAPVLIATCYFLAATIIFPTEHGDFDQLGRYFAERKQFIVAMLFAAELLVSYTYIPVFADTLRHRPAVFWLYHVPYNLMIKSTFVLLLLAKRRRSVIVLEIILILLFFVPYWGHGPISHAIEQRFASQWPTSP